MKKIFTFAMLLLVASCGRKIEAFLSPHPQQWALLWKDEFDYHGLPDSTIWGYDVGGHGWGNEELQHYTDRRPENARVENGMLLIEARKEPFGERQYSSARLVTRHKKPILYGRVEVRAKLPTGVGSWPAIWMLGENLKSAGWPLCGEIDIMEHVGHDPNRIHASVHTHAYNHIQRTQKTNNKIISNVSDTFHVYSIEWTPQKIDFFIDDASYLSFSKADNASKQQWPFDLPHYLLLNIAVGGFWGGEKGVDNNIFPLKMYIDYVRVFQQKRDK